MITQLIWTIWTSLSTVPRKAVKSNHSLTHPDVSQEDCAGYMSGTKRKYFAALSSPLPWWWWLQLQPSCGFPQCCSHKQHPLGGYLIYSSDYLQMLQFSYYSNHLIFKMSKVKIVFYWCHTINIDLSLVFYPYSNAQNVSDVSLNNKKYSRVKKKIYIYILIMLCLLFI